MEQRFVVNNRIKSIAAILGVVGLIIAVIGIVTTKDGFEMSRFWSSLLFNNLFFTWIALIGAFFIAAFGLGYSGWHTLIKRIPEAMAHFIFVGLPLVLFIFLFGKQHIYEWTDHHIMATDSFLIAKKWWLNNAMFIGFTLAWIFLMCFGFWQLRKNSIALDNSGSYKLFSKSLTLSAIFLFFFAVMNSVSTWHWVMSTEPHWYSTLYGWYLFASSLASGIAVMIIILILLKRAGFLPQVNINHFHDLGKFLFAFSIFWTYLWVSQYMLIWYANIPEETIHFKYLLENHKVLFTIAFILNFIVPLLVLMSRDAKRNLGTLLFMSCVILVGHWIDFFLMIRPGAERFANHKAHMSHDDHAAVETTGNLLASAGGGGGSDHAAHQSHDVVMSIGLLEIGLGVAFAGLFIFVVSWALTKANLVPKNHPFERESIEHHI